MSALDMASFRAGAKDIRTGKSVALGLVVADDDSGAHFELRGSTEDVWVRVELQPEQRKVWCRLGGMAGGVGMIAVPAVGTECLVFFPGGEIHADPVLGIVLSTGSVLVDSTTGRVVVAGSLVKLGAATGTVALALAPPQAAFNTQVASHTHVAPSGGGETTGPFLSCSGAVLNPAHGMPGHVHGSPEPIAAGGTSIGAGSIAATKVEGV